MSDTVKLIVEIPTGGAFECDIYTPICAEGFIRDEYNEKVAEAIKNGIPLPEGHGRLIDADAFIATLEDVSKRHKYKELLIDDRLTVDDVFKAIIESLQNKGLAEGDAPTIIEADTRGDKAE